MSTVQQQPTQSQLDYVTRCVGTAVALLMIISGAAFGTWWFVAPGPAPIKADPMTKVSLRAAEIAIVRKRMLDDQKKLNQLEREYYEAYGQASYDAILGRLPWSWRPTVEKILGPTTETKTKK